MGVVAISYTAQDTTVYQVIFKNFIGGQLPRTYLSETTFSYAVKGASLISGPSYRNKRTWAINSLISAAEAQTAENLFSAWDYDRSLGYPSALGLIDSTFGSTITVNVVISAPPSFVRINANYYEITLVLNEV